LTEFLQQVINGLSLGAVYALLALGYTMVYGILRFINFAHCDVFMVGAFVGYYAVTPFTIRVAKIGLSLPVNLHIGTDSIAGGTLALLLAMAFCALLGIIIERLAYRPLRQCSKLTVLITAIGVSLFLENMGQLVFGADPKPFPELFPVREFSLGAINVSSNQLLVMGVSALLVIGLQFIVKRTKMGTAMRAVSLNPVAASLVGINNDRVISLTFGLGSALAAAGGILYALNYPAINPYMGILPGLKAFVAAVLGGIGNIRGAALGGVLLGLVETFVNGSHYSTYKDAIAFAVLILILLFRPAGLLGKVETEKI
jgi:branched-chain amino acid transport system permease protein